MSDYNFEESASYRISKHLYDAQKEFIVLGLCGKVGSGVSEVSKILEQRFEELHLPQPGFQGRDSYDEHEYRILYKYAEKNWRKADRIRTSALITRHILTKSKDEAFKFLKEFIVNDGMEKKLKEYVETFFDREMSFDR